MARRVTKLELLRDYREVESKKFINKVSRDLMKEHMIRDYPEYMVSTSTISNVRLHPEYIQDAKQEGIEYETGFGNVDYMRFWKKLYIVTLWSPKEGV